MLYPLSYGGEAAILPESPRLAVRAQRAFAPSPRLRSQSSIR